MRTEHGIPASSSDLDTVCPVPARIVGLLRELIRLHPLYGSSGQREALSLVEACLVGAGMQVSRVRTDRDELRRLPDCIDVAAFGGNFADYWDLAPLEGIIARESFGDGAGPRILVNGHLDVEFVTAPESWFEPDGWRNATEVGDRIYGRGASDTLGGVACLIGLMDDLLPVLRQNGNGELILQFVLDEELGGNGTVALNGGGELAIDLALVLEPTDGAVCTATHGFEQLVIEVQGRPVHMTSAAPADNAIAALPHVLRAVGILNGELQRMIRRPGSYAMAGIVEAGTDAAVPASRAFCYVTLALPPAADSRRTRSRLADLLADEVAPWNPVIRPYGIALPPADELPGALDWARRFVQSATHHEARTRIETFASACDARFFTCGGVPTLVVGAGSLKRAHGSDEYVTRRELENFRASLTSFFLDVLTSTGPHDLNDR